ncbi:MAG: hypothetical protein EA382_15855 [Spirochaetaceae bacterium]|nr:MAG: hypothetical protein EA382_15855 [Spirochaetaceae bacterium]
MAFLVVALLIFALLGIEFPVFFLTNLVDGQTPFVVDWPANWYALLVHWTVTITIWTAGIALAYRWAKRTGVVNELVRFRVTARDAYVTAAGAVLAIAFGVLHARFTGLAAPQLLREYRGFQAMYGDHAWILSLFQNVYYLVEYVLVAALVALFQRVGERWSRMHWFPWGSVGVFATWGMIHLVTSPHGAAFVLVWSIVPGALFVIARKSFWPVVLVSALGFII